MDMPWHVFNALTHPQLGFNFAAKVITTCAIYLHT